MATRIATALAVAAAFAGGLVAASAAEQESGARTSDQPAHSDQAVSFAEPPGGSPLRILGIGGLVVRASCERYGDNEHFLSVGARSKVEGAVRALALSGPALAESARSFAGNDFGPGYGWYDLIGSTPGGAERGTLVYARPDGAQVSLSFEARSDRCTFDGLARYVP